ncbi:hypothetical protein [Eoetvoesiella caeni]
MIIKTPEVLVLQSLFMNISCVLVRMKQFDEKENQVLDGRMLWPEVLVCRDGAAAQTLMEFLNQASFNDAFEDWREGEPELTEAEAYERWEKEDIAQYIVEHVDNLAQSDYLYQITESLMVVAQKFPDLQYV